MQSMLDRKLAVIGFAAHFEVGSQGKSLKDAQRVINKYCSLLFIFHFCAS